MRLARSATAAVLSWLLQASLCAAQPFQVVGYKLGVGPICMGPLGPGPCVDVQQYIATNQIGLPASIITAIEAALRQAAATDPRAAVLGRPGLIRYSSPLTSQGLTLLTARVIQERGSSEWRLGLLPDGQIAIQQLEGLAPQGVQSNLVFGPGIHNELSVIIRNPGQMMDGNNSVFNDPVQILPSPKPSPMPSPHRSPIDISVSATPPPPQVDNRVVEFLIATTRKKESQTNAILARYSGNRANLSFGAASVRVPEDHKIGRIELPGSWSLFGLTLASAPNDREHFIIKRVVSVSEDTFSQTVKNTGARRALIFVHGFNSSFDDSILRNAQIVWDLQFRGLSVLFSWASRGDVTDYGYDKESAYLARGSFIKLVEKLRREYGIEEVNILAHSMGNLVTLDALAGYAQTSNPASVARFMMAAPDVDRDLFIDLAPKAKSIVGGITLYASSADRALALSRRLAGNIPRAGDVPLAGPIEMPGVVETIDVTAVGDDVLGLNHNVFAASRDVMEDISALLRNNQPPPRLTQIRAVPEPPNAVKYWRYVR